MTNSRLEVVLLAVPWDSAEMLILSSWRWMVLLAVLLHCAERRMTDPRLVVVLLAL